MFKYAKKTLHSALSFILIFTLAIIPQTLFAASTSWNFKDNAFKNLGTISSSTTVSNLGLIATSSKTMSVIANSKTLDGTTYTHCLALGGSGSTSYRAIKVPVNGSSTIKVTLMSSSSSTRALVIANSSGNELTTLSATSSLAVQSYKYTGSSGHIYLYSSNSGINIFKIQVDDSSSDSDSSSTTPSGNSLTVTNGGLSLASAVSKAKSGTTIIVKGTVKSGTIKLPAGVTIQGESNATIDFSQTSGSSGRGFQIDTNGSTLKNIKIINAADNGIFISGSNNTFINVETAYNKDAGVQVSNGGSYNKFYKCYSHHNADTTGENADGFAVKLHSGEGNYFEDCTAEYNSDDGWDLYAAHGAVTFVRCNANYNGNCNGIKGDGNGFKLGGVDNKTSGVAAHLDPLNHKLTDCNAKGNTKNGFDRNNQSGVVTMIRCTGDSNKGKNFSWPLTGTPSALGYKVTFGKAILNNCTSINGSNNITGATLTNCIGF